jgi:hypothetical protein
VVLASNNETMFKWNCRPGHNCTGGPKPISFNKVDSMAFYCAGPPGQRRPPKERAPVAQAGNDARREERRRDYVANADQTEVVGSRQRQQKQPGPVPNWRRQNGPGPNRPPPPKGKGRRRHPGPPPRRLRSELVSNCFCIYK